MSFIETSQNGHILEIKVNRADKHNALSPRCTKTWLGLMAS